jgi:hypothetical protein
MDVARTARAARGRGAAAPRPRPPCAPAGCFGTVSPSRLRPSRAVRLPLAPGEAFARSDAIARARAGMRVRAGLWVVVGARNGIGAPVRGAEGVVLAPPPVRRPEVPPPPRRVPRPRGGFLPRPHGAPLLPPGKRHGVRQGRLPRAVSALGECCSPAVEPGPPALHPGCHGGGAWRWGRPGARAGAAGAGDGRSGGARPGIQKPARGARRGGGAAGSAAEGENCLARAAGRARRAAEARWAGSRPPRRAAARAGAGRRWDRFERRRRRAGAARVGGARAAMAGGGIWGAALVAEGDRTGHQGVLARGVRARGGCVCRAALRGGAPPASSGGAPRQVGGPALGGRRAGPWRRRGLEDMGRGLGA